MAQVTDHIRTLVQSHIELFNLGVRTGDFGPMLEQFEPDATLDFRDVDAGPFHGTAAIATAYREQPPDDQINLLGITADGDAIVADFAWLGHPEARAGQMRMQAGDGKISEMVVVFER